MTYPQWLQPPMPALTGNVREHSHADEFRAARLEHEKRSPNRDIKKALIARQARVAADMAARGETMAERKARQTKESKIRRAAFLAGLQKP